jgi:carboxypeptidase Taq
MRKRTGAGAARTHATSPAGALDRLKEHQRETQSIAYAAAVLGWDQETYMPPAAVEGRAEQLAVLEGLVHARTASPEVGELLATLGATDARPGGSPGLPDIDAALVRETHRAYRRATRLPGRLVTALARQASLSQARWAEARKRSSFELFRSSLEEIVKLTIEKAECLGHSGHRYDPLLDEFEPWTTTRDVAEVFAGLEPALRDLTRRIASSGRQPARLDGYFPVAQQRALSDRLLRDMGFDLRRGRLDVSAHPFSTALGHADARLTTRFDEGNATSGLFGTIHECGHGLYEQGLDDRLAGTILAGAASLGFHESQSRFWENMVGRSASFWRRYYPVLRDLFPDALHSTDLDGFVRSVNRVEPSLIRVEADEVTYGLHIILRFNLETMLVAGELRVADLPEAWSSQSRSLLGITPARDSEGVLQDIHWSMGSIGYFPTYALGNLYAGQLREAMQRDLGDLTRPIEAGELDALLQWLREKVHRHGRVYPAGELCRRVTGSSLDAGPYLRYLNEKFAALYELAP